MVKSLNLKTNRKLFFVEPNASVKFSQALRVFIIGGFEQFAGAPFTDESGGGKDSWRVTGHGEASSDFRFDAIDEHTTTHS
jgi:hypothetical protein